MTLEATFTDFEGLPDDVREILERRAESLSQLPSAEEDGDHMLLLTFCVGEEWYGLDVDSVVEIHTDYHVTPLPSVPRHILGVINIRGQITSVTRFASLLDLPGAEGAEEPVIVVSDGDVETAMQVDSIGDVVEVERGSLEPPLSVIDKKHLEYIEGSVAVGDRLVAVVNLRKVLEPIGDGQG